MGYFLLLFCFSLELFRLVVNLIDHLDDGCPLLLLRTLTSYSGNHHYLVLLLIVFIAGEETARHCFALESIDCWVFGSWDDSGMAGLLLVAVVEGELQHVHAVTHT
jgi:hypothetical protein